MPIPSPLLADKTNTDMDNFAKSSYRWMIGVFCLLPLLSLAQTPADSLALARAQWQSEQLLPGLDWKHAHFSDLFDSEQQVNILQIDLAVPERRLAFAGLADGLALTSTFATKAGAQAGINATFFNMKEGGSVTFLKIDGTVVNETSLLLPNGQNHERANGALVVDRQEVSIITGDPQAVGWDKLILADNVMVCGPVLLRDGVEVPLGKNAFNNNRHPRSAVGITADGKVILVTVDGRNARAHGMSLPELAFLLRQTGAHEALNLDGGGSTALYINGKNETGIVNYPSDNKIFDHGGERSVANAILVF